MILDIRTLSIKKDEVLRTKDNNAIKKCCQAYDFTTIISEGTRDAISLDKQKSAIVPLGSDVISTTEKTFDTLRFLIQYSVFKVQCNLVKFKALKACFHKLLILQDYSVPARDRATFVARCIVSDTVEMEGFEPLTPCLQGRCSPN